MCLFLLFSVSFNFYSEEYEKNLRIKLEQKKNFLVIEYINLSDDDIYVPDYYICNNVSFINDYFEVIDEQGRKIEYTGIIGDFGIYEMYVKIKKGSSIKSLISLEEFYAVQKNSKYEVRYNFSGMQSDAVTFYYK